MRWPGALERFRGIVGLEWFFSREKVASYCDPYTIANDPQSHKARSAVAPTSTEQVQAIVKVAKELRVPLWTTSQTGVGRRGSTRTDITRQEL
jgi:4-cresol dehydrogenase (hydroxylating)